MGITSIVDVPMIVSLAIAVLVSKCPLFYDRGHTDSPILKNLSDSDCTRPAVTVHLTSPDCASPLSYVGCDARRYQARLISHSTCRASPSSEVMSSSYLFSIFYNP